MQSRLSFFAMMLLTSWLMSCGGSGGQSSGNAAGSGDVADPVMPDPAPLPAPTPLPTPSPTPSPTPAPSPAPSSNAPEASFAASVAGSVEDHDVTFTDTSSPAATSRTWTFGDGASSTDQTAQHAFAEPGNYVVTLFVQNAYGFSSVSKVFPVLQAGVAATAASEPGKEWIAAHNSVRAGTFPGIPISPAPDPALPALSWSQAAADIAQAYANQCKYAHNTSRSSDGIWRGENIYAGAPGGNAGITPLQLLVA